jgi:hypothetical protein
MKITLNKKIWKWQKRSKSDPRRKEADESNILSYTVSGIIWTVSSILQCKQLKYGVLQSNKTVTTRRENKLSRR